MRKNRSLYAERNQHRVDVFAALGEETRLRLVMELVDCNGESRSISKLSENSNLSRQAITRHLQVLEHAGIVECTRIGRESHFRLELVPLQDASEYLNRISTEWDASLSRLKSFVEDEKK